MINQLKKYSLLGTLAISSILIFFGCSDTEKDTQSIIRTENNLEKSSSQGLLKENDYGNIFWIKGTGSIKQKQEIIEVNIAIESRDKQIINATNIVNKNISKIIQIAEDIGIEKDQIVTSEFSITPVTRWVEKKDEFGEYGESQIIAYKVYNSVIVNSEDKDNITTFIDRSNLETGNSFRVNNIRFKAKVNDENKVLAREKAVEDALEKADFYEKELGIKLGKIISFEEFQPGLPANKSSYDMPMMRMSAAEAMPSTELFAGESEIVSEIYIGFEIE
tara:strand:+ start:707 stop:1537 length:831 start_codon:yes stop_codon:yes gene_type:complete